MIQKLTFSLNYDHFLNFCFSVHETIEEIANKVVKAEVHRIIVVDDGFRVIGIVSLSDLLAYMVRE